MYAGKAGFVIGNGVSAEFYDLNKLYAAGINIGCNRAHETDPLHFLCWQDSGILESCAKFKGFKVTAMKKKKREVLDPKTTFYFRLGKTQGETSLFRRGHSGLLAIQLAYHLGCDPIILVGCDCRGFKENGKWRFNRFSDKPGSQVNTKHMDIIEVNGRPTVSLLKGFAHDFDKMIKTWDGGRDAYHLGDYSIVNIPPIEFEEFWSDKHPGRRRHA